MGLSYLYYGNPYVGNIFLLRRVPLHLWTMERKHIKTIKYSKHIIYLLIRPKTHMH